MHASHLNAHDSPNIRKARGAFFTPPELCTYLAEWAVRETSDRVLEPSCGQGDFLVAAGTRLRELGAQTPTLLGVEIHPQTVSDARRHLASRGFHADIRSGDFLARVPTGDIDAVIGNPPYVRYQGFHGNARTTAQRAALRAGVRLTSLASSWAAFTVHAALFLAPEGRMALVLPAELLSVNYAAEVRAFLMRRFARVRLVLFTERVFPGVQEEVVLLQAEGTGPTDHCELHQVRTVDDLVEHTREVSRWSPTDPTAKWTDALVNPAARRVSQTVIAQGGFTPLRTWGETTLGAVTGNNGYFTLSPSTAKSLGIDASDLCQISPPGSRHLRLTLDYTLGLHTQLGADGKATQLFRPGGQPSPGADAYIAHGARTGVDGAYKCRVRRPWWRVPLPPVPDLLLTYMNADAPRLVTNSAGVHHINSIHGVYLRPEVAALGREMLPLASLNSMTLLGAETVGRAYGGGVLKIEPREADALPVPAAALVDTHADALRAVRSEVLRCLDQGRPLDACALVDPIVLGDGVGLTPTQIAELAHARALLAGRRASRSRRGSA